MTTRRAFVILAALAVAALASLAMRYALGVERRMRQGSPARRVTLRFFKNPAPVPPLTLTDLDGRQLSSADWRGKVVLLNFWATWCGPCRAEIPDLVALQERYRDQLQIIGISEDETSPEFVRRFAVELKVNYPIVMETPELRKIFSGIYALPTSFFLDRETRIVQKHVGMLDPAVTEQEARLLAGLSVNASVEQVDKPQPVGLDNAAQATSIPGVDLASLTPNRRTEALQKLNSEACTCGCELTVARCRIDDPSCGVSLPRAREIVQQIAGPP